MGIYVDSYMDLNPDNARNISQSVESSSPTRYFLDQIAFIAKANQK